jgi:hypothetical protein
MGWQRPNRPLASLLRIKHFPKGMGKMSKKHNTEALNKMGSKIRIPVPDRPTKVILPRKGKGSYNRDALKNLLKRSIADLSEDV